ncbi:hypothetical protein AVEN_254274-1 [Araneus ventricosus]|uniref:Uncharacterized protein n=1 Tax=Araneus ventricosus TaxID=182803 RepID=A0A4Y2M589_ARAVE|nr:hypothetical protein AVEN_254274-1 [Araneus ventricosus]
MIAKGRWYHRNIDIRNALNVPSLQQFIQNLAKIFYGKLPDINSPEITKIPVYDHNDKRNHSDLICKAVCSSSLSWVVCLLPSLSNLIAEGDLLNDIRRNFSVVTINEFRSGRQVYCCEDGNVEFRNDFINIFDVLDVGVPWERGAHNLLEFNPISSFNNLAYGWEVDINISSKGDWIVVTAKCVDRIRITRR